MRLRFALALLSLAGALPASVLFGPQASVSLGGAQSAVDRNAGSASFNGSLKLNPAWIFSQGPSLSIGLTAGMSGQQQALEENTLFARSASLGASIDWTQPAGWGRMPLHVDFKRSLNSRTDKEAWGKGLYDWEQVTGSTGYRLKEDRWKAGLNVSAGHRSYSNYRDPSAVLAGGKGYYFKDYDFGGVSGSINAGLGAAWAGALGYNLELRQFGDAYVTRKNGTLDLGAQQREDMHTLSLGLMHNSRSDEFGYQAELGWSLLNSNNGYFDTSTNIYVPNADGFDAESLALKLIWNADDRVQGLAMDLLGSVQNRNSRLPIRGRDGSYSLGTQSDLSYSTRLAAAYALPWRLQLNAQAELSAVTSNQGYAPVGSSQYTMFNFSTGLSWNWSRY